MRAAALVLLLAGAAGASEIGKLYEEGTEQRRQGETRASRETFLRLLALSPEDAGGLEGLALADLALGRYQEAQEILERWNAKSPRDPAILRLLSRAYDSRRREDKTLSLRRTLAELEPDDLSQRRRLDRLLKDYEPGLFPEASSAKAIAPEGLDTAAPQRIVYESRSGGMKARARAAPFLDVTAGALARQESQRNDTGGFTYYNILEQLYSAGLEARPADGLALGAEYGQSLFSDIHGAGVGRVKFSRGRLSSQWRSWDSIFRLTAARSPRFLRGAGSSRFLTLLRETSAEGSAETALAGWDWRLRAAVADYSEQTTLKTGSVLASKEWGDTLLQPGYAHDHQEFYGATADGRLGAVGLDRWGLRARRLIEGVYRAEASYAYNVYRDANRRHEGLAEGEAWLPWLKELSGGYRLSVSNYLASTDLYRSSDEEIHWLTTAWRRGMGAGLWLNAGYEHGFARDSRGRYEANVYLGGAEWHWKDRASFSLQAKRGRSSVQDDSYSVGFQGRCGF